MNKTKIYQEITNAFTGKITRHPIHEITFLVDKVFKSSHIESQDTTKVVTGTEIWDCGFYFGKGQIYLLYARGANITGQFMTSECTKTKELKWAKEEELLLLSKLSTNKFEKK